MKKLFIIVLAVMAVSSAFGKDAPQYEKPMLGLCVPSGLADNQMYVDFGHKFYRTLANYPSGDLFALLKSGANLNIGLRYMIWNGIEANAAYIISKDEKDIGISYAMKFPALFFNTQANLQFFDYEDPSRFQQARNFFYLVSAQTVPLWDDRLTAAINIGWDGYLNTPGFGLGLSLEVIKDIAVVAEYYPFLQGDGEDSEGPEKAGVYSFGIKYSTFGHQFMLKFGNSAEIGPKQMMQGALKNDIYVGLSLMRLVDFNPEEK